MYATGDHYELYKILLDMGYRPKGDAETVYNLAGKILARGYE